MMIIHPPRTSRASFPKWAHRAVTSVLAASTLVIGLAACGSDDDDSNGTSANTDFEPVTISHALGEAEITEKPERVVTLGQGSAETALALGIVPVGTEEYEWGADESGQLPWIHEELENEGVAEDDYPELISAGDNGVSAEEIAKLDPDVILAPWSGITEEQYDSLSALAPTVAYPEKPWTIDWKDQITTVATAIRKGTVVAPTENSFVTGSSIVNPLTVPWSIDRYVPMIKDAITRL